MTRRFVGHPARGEVAQFLVNERQQFLRGFGIAFLSTFQDAGDVAHRALIPAFGRRLNLFPAARGRGMPACRPPGVLLRAMAPTPLPLLLRTLPLLFGSLAFSRGALNDFKVTLKRRAIPPFDFQSWFPTLSCVRALAVISTDLNKVWTRCAAIRWLARRNLHSRGYGPKRERCLGAKGFSERTAG